MPSIMKCATKGLQACGVPEKKDNTAAGPTGLLSLRPYLAAGWQVLVF